MDDGRIDEAAAIGLGVCRVAATLASVRVVDQLDDLMATLEHLSAPDEVVRFRAALNELHQSNELPTPPSTWPI